MQVHITLDKYHVSKFSQLHIKLTIEHMLTLMNHPHLSGKLAHLDLALQELDLIIHYWPGKLNQPADSLSRCLRNAFGQAAEKHLALGKDREVIPEKDSASAVEKETTLSKRQTSDPKLAMMIKYLQSGDLHLDKKNAREIIQGNPGSYTVIDNILYLSVGISLKIVLPKKD